jgi:hypothetical protein
MKFFFFWVCSCFFLWHVYVLSIAYQPNGAAPISSTTKRVHGKLVLPNGTDMAEYSTPRAIETKEIPGIVEDFRVSARNCIEAGALKNIQPHLLLVYNDHCVEKTHTDLPLSLSVCIFRVCEGHQIYYDDCTRCWLCYLEVCCCGDFLCIFDCKLMLYTSSLCTSNYRPCKAHVLHLFLYY